MKRSIVIFILSLITMSTAFAMDQRLEGAEFVGSDARTKQQCWVRIEKIEKNFFVPDHVTILVRIGDGAEESTTLAGFDFTDGSYSSNRGQDVISFKVADDATATYQLYRYRRDGMVDMPAFSSGYYRSDCQNLRRVDSGSRQDERVNESMIKAVPPAILDDGAPPLVGQGQ